MDYGALRVADDAVRPVAIKNLGKYPLSFKFAARTPAIRSLVTVLPEEGSVEPGKEAAVQVRSCPPFPSQYISGQATSNELAIHACRCFGRHQSPCACVYIPASMQCRLLSSLMGVRLPERCNCNPQAEHLLDRRLASMAHLQQQAAVHEDQ